MRPRIAATDAVDETGAKIKHGTAPSTNTSSVTASARVVWSEGGDVRSSDVRRWALGRDNRWRGGRGARQPLLACCCWLLAAGYKKQNVRIIVFWSNVRSGVWCWGVTAAGVAVADRGN